MVRIAARQAVVVDENLELALAQRRTVEVRQMIYCRAGRVHGRLVNQMELPEKGRVPRRRTGHGGQAFKERHSWRSMAVEHDGHRIGETLDRTELRLGVIRSPV